MIDTAPPTRADVMSVIGKLEGLRPPAPVAVPDPEPVQTPEPAPPVATIASFTSASAPAVDVPAASREVVGVAAPDSAIRELMIERDAWRAAAEDLRADLRRELQSVHADAERQQTQSDGLGLELEQLRQYAESLRVALEEERARPHETGADTTALQAHLQQQQALFAQQQVELQQQRVELAALRADAINRDQQVTHLTSAITSLIEIAQTRTAEPAMPAAPSAPAEPVRTLRPRGGYDLTDGPGDTSPLTDGMAIPKLAPDSGQPAHAVRLGVVVPKRIVTRDSEPQTVPAAVAG